MSSQAGKDKIKTAAADDIELLDRPSFNFRLQMVLFFLTIFSLSVIITISAMVTIGMIERRMAMVQTWDRFLFNIDQARRWEKNFFLYNTNLDDALESIEAAIGIFNQNADSFDFTSHTWQKAEMVQHLKAYHLALIKLSRLVAEQAVPIDATVASEHNLARYQIENNLRHYGAQIVEEAAELARHEYDLVFRWLRLLQKVPGYFLVFLFVLLILMIRFLSQRFMKPLESLIRHTRRIAQGDLTPLKSYRLYKDEFTTVEVAINRMLKELKARQHSLIEAHKLRAVGILTAGVAHELNNPLNNIMLTAHTLLEEHQDLEESEKLEMVKDIIEETDRSRSIVHNLLDFSRESRSVMEPLNLGRLVMSTAKLALNQAMVRGIPIDVQVEDALPDIIGDRHQLKQVFLNLILNALDAVGQSGAIQVRVQSRSPSTVIVQVEDNGCGISADALPHVFDPFYTTKPVGKGTGLGLSVSHGIITKHGGQITAESIPGQKTVFTVTLPLFPTVQSNAGKPTVSEEPPH